MHKHMHRCTIMLTRRTFITLRCSPYVSRSMDLKTIALLQTLMFMLQSKLNALFSRLSPYL